MKTVKKICSMLLAFCIIFGFSACGCNHEWQDATCIEPKTCSLCGATEGEPLGHIFEDATCTKPKTCRRCGETEGESLGHDYVDGYCTRCDKKDPNYYDNYGFNDMQYAKVTLVSIYGYNSEYVYTKEGTNFYRGNYITKYILQNGYITHIEEYYPLAYVDEKENRDDFTRSIGQNVVESVPYYIISNDQISFAGESILITERIKLSNSVVVLKAVQNDRAIWFAIEEQFDETKRVKTEKIYKASGYPKHYHTETRYYF